MIENLIRALIASLDANTAAHGGTVPADSTGAADAAETTAATTTTAGKTTGKTTTPKGPTREEVVALLTKIKDENGASEAKPLVALAGVVKMAEIPDDKLKIVFDAATAYLAPKPVEEDDGDL